MRDLRSRRDGCFKILFAACLNVNETFYQIIFAGLHPNSYRLNKREASLSFSPTRFRTVAKYLVIACPLSCWCQTASWRSGRTNASLSAYFPRKRFSHPLFGPFHFPPSSRLLAGDICETNVWTASGRFCFVQGRTSCSPFTRNPRMMLSLNEDKFGFLLAFGMGPLVVMRRCRVK